MSSEIKFGKAIPYDIHIRALDNFSFHVKVGCCQCSFPDRRSLIEALDDYLQNPEKIASEYDKMSGVTNDTIEYGPPVSSQIEYGRPELRNRQCQCEDRDCSTQDEEPNYSIGGR
jgi:hypothetical protein